MGYRFSSRASCTSLLAAALTSFALAVSSAAAATALTRGPYLQRLGTTAVTVVWNTDLASDCALAVRPLDGGAPIVLTGPASAVCAIPVTGLLPGRAYGYVPRAGATALGAESSFTTDGAGRPFTFLVVGDTGSGGSEQLAVRDQMVASPADFVLHTGDMVYDSGEAERYDPRFFEPYADLLTRLVFWPCLGNHDVRTASGQPWRDAFYTPANNTARSENYYSFDFGNAHVAVLNSNASTAPGSAQYVFLDEDLGASTATWKVVAFHHTIYSSSKHGSNTTVRANLVPLFDRHAVDLVFMGHDHVYERTLPLRGGQVVAPGAGTVYVTTGGGGRELYAAGTSSFTAHSESAHHFTRVSVDDDALLLEMVRADGAIRDEMGLVKDAGPTPSRTATPVATATAVRTAAGTASPRATATTTRTRTATPIRTPTPVLTPVGRRVEPIADTYIEAGTEASWSHGGSDHLDVDVKPFGVTYLAFDLSAEPSPIARALLALYVTNASDDGGSVVRLPVSPPWTEGTATGIDATSAGAVGLRWTDVDRNGDRRLDAADASPLVPDAGPVIASLGPVARGQRVVVDVTAAFTAGPGRYTLAITNTSSDGVTFSSREHPTAAQRPALYVTGGVAAPTRSPTPSVVAATRTATATPLRTASPPASASPTVVRTATPPASASPTPVRSATPPRTATATPRPSATPAPDATAAPSACLSGTGPLILLSGTLSTKYTNHGLAPLTRIDARTASFLGSPTNHYPVNLAGGAGACITGGRVLGQYDRSRSWDSMHDENNAGIAFDNAAFSVEGLRVDNVTDGIRPEGPGPFTIRHTWLSYVRDDCVENDHVQGGLIEDSLFDGCYVAIAERPTSSIIAGGWDGRGQTLTIRRTLIHLAAMPGPRNGAATAVGHEGFFKWSDRATNVALHDNVFMADQVGQGGAGSMGVPATLTACSNNVMVWLGPGDYPARLPSCFTVTKDRGVWDRAVTAWKRAHPALVE
ncbi:MAG: metallophosphoesterase [Deltaproteobacteria bacterium]|nr:metallophosphoesterase [Deltaproteobacteria bacterium]